MESYAFAWGHIEQGKVPTETVFEQIIEVIEGFKWGDQSTYPRMQQGGHWATVTPEDVNFIVFSLMDIVVYAEVRCALIDERVPVSCARF